MERHVARVGARHPLLEPLPVAGRDGTDEIKPPESLVVGGAGEFDQAFDDLVPARFVLTARPGGDFDHRGVVVVECGEQIDVDMTGGDLGGASAYGTGGVVGEAVGEHVVAQGTEPFEGAECGGTYRRVVALQAEFGHRQVPCVAGRSDDAEHQDATIRRAIDEFGRLDILVNNTAVNPAYGPLTRLDEGIARKIMDVNVVAALGWVQETFRAWMKEHGGAVVNVSSLAGVKPAPFISFYGASKAALISLTEALALASEARAAGLEIMVGCMLATSLGIAPAALVAQGARWVDLDGALLLAEDRDGAMTMQDGILQPPSPELWG